MQSSLEVTSCTVGSSAKNFGQRPVSKRSKMASVNMNPEKIFPLIECINTFLCGLMTGIAVYVVAVEQPSRMSMKDPVAIHRQWLTSFHRCARLMMGLSVFPQVSGVVAYYMDRTRGFPWLIVAGLLLFNMPYTLLVLKPYFIDPILDENTCSKKDHKYVVDRVVKWSRAHLVRVLINVIAFDVCIYTIVY